MSNSLRPTPVTVAVVLLWIQAALALLLALVAFAGAANVTALTEQSAAHGESVDHLRTVMVTAGVVLLIVAVINALFASRIGRGHHTARLVYTVLAVLGIVGTVASAASSGQATHWASAIIPIVILILIWLPESSKEFFRQSRSADVTS